MGTPLCLVRMGTLAFFLMGTSWSGLLEKINRTDFTTDQVKGIPFPMQAVLLSKDHVDVSLHDLQRELTHCEVHPWLSEQLQRLLAMPFDCILTPNFTYEIQCAVMPDFVDHAPRYLTHTCAVPLAEKSFMLHTYYDLPVVKLPLWFFSRRTGAENTALPVSASTRENVSALTVPTAVLRPWGQ